MDHDRKHGDQRNAEAQPMATLQLFSTAQAARDYRHEHGSGGWIFTDDEVTVLFPPHMPPAHIFSHPLMKGRSGELIGA